MGNQGNRKWVTGYSNLIFDPFGRIILAGLIFK